MSADKVRIGTRGSALALAQATETRERLVAASGRPAEDFEIVVIKTSGDRILDRPLSEVGGKGLFTKEIEDALLAGTIDLAVHSSKDMPTILPDGLTISAFLPREDVRDAFVSPRAESLSALPPGAVVGTASLRRQAMVKRARPDLAVVTFRGNVQSRLAKLAAGEVDATLLALAGLRRLGLEHVVTAAIAPQEFLPAVGQGAICLESRADDDATSALVASIHHGDTGVALALERAFLHELDGSCRTPIAGWARVVGESVIFDGEILTPDGSVAHAIARSGPIGEAAAIGREAGRVLKERGGPRFFQG
ncbi:hydroxymethylbilane synthase [Siculibacillus lacustris]|uniref:Porphobilinogen deaminase n=1 Tax=Siculibacillus lacustris TaxID=1549641 RepID=A0A4Q9VNG6_9HYPH|nr:hydroxymethylbilane synthase [Siculibacillus lacustris]TBW36329.1 hydroxymethylbilane synthase [Siculibacillus lacustris]